MEEGGDPLQNWQSEKSKAKLECLVQLSELIKLGCINRGGRPSLTKSQCFLLDFQVSRTMAK